MFAAAAYCRCGPIGRRTPCSSSSPSPCRGVLLLRLIRVPAGALHRFPLYVPAASLFLLLALGPCLRSARPLEPRHPEAAARRPTAITTLGRVRSDLGSNRSRSGRALRRLGRCAAPAGAPGAVRPPAGFWCRGAPADQRPRRRRRPRWRRPGGAGADLLPGASASADPGADRVPPVRCALAAEWGFSLRSQSVIGFDIDTEIYIAQHTQVLGIWHVRPPGQRVRGNVEPHRPAQSPHARSPDRRRWSRSSCSTPSSRRCSRSPSISSPRGSMTRRFAAIAAAVLLVQDYFFQGPPGLARQEIAMLFFAVLIAVAGGSITCAGPQLRLRSPSQPGWWSPLLEHVSGDFDSGHRRPAPGAGPWRRDVGPPFRRSAVLAAVLIGGAGLWYGALTHSGTELTVRRPR